MNTEEVKIKRCCRCGRELPISEFSKCRKYKDGLMYECRSCNNRWWKKYNGYYVYTIFDKNNEIVYVGITTNFYKRFSNHLSGYVDSTKELFDNDEWGSIKYLDVSDLVANNMELKVLENMLIEIYEPKLNKAKNIIRDVSNGRLFSLIATLHNINNEWIIFKINE